MAVDVNWLNQVRNKNQEAVGLAGMGSSDLAAALRSRQAASSAAAAAAAASAMPQQQGDVLSLPAQSKLTKYILYGAIAVAGIAVVVAVSRRFRKRK